MLPNGLAEEGGKEKYGNQPEVAMMAAATSGFHAT